MKLAIACDHAGFEQLKELQSFLESLGHNCENFGPEVLTQDDDYPDYIFPAAEAVAGKKCDAGIILGGSGQGEAMAANRLKGVRCAVYYGPAVPRKVVDASGRTSNDPFEIVKLSRLHNDANMISLAARFVSVEDMKQVIRVWLETDFNNEARHKRRIVKLDKK